MSEEGLEGSLVAIVSFDLTGEMGTHDEREEVYQIEDQLDYALQKAKVGDCDGHGFGNNKAELYLYGTDAEGVYKTVEPILRGITFKPVQVVLLHDQNRGNDAREEKRFIA